MKVIKSAKTEKFSFTLKLSDERLKLFLDIAPILPATVTSKKEEQKQDQSEKEEKSVSDTLALVQEPLTISKEDILAILPKEVWDGCIHYDVIENVVKELNQGLKIEERRIAKGIEAQDGTDGRFVITVKKMSPKVEIHEDAKGYIDFKDLHRFENIRIGTIVAKLYPPKPGVAGSDPLGKALPAKNGQPSKLTFDETIAANNHSEGAGQDLVAKIDGYLSDENGKLSIKEELKISGSIDYKVGSIDFVGTVIITGDVLPGFVVRGRKGVVVRGSVQEATVCSSEGSVEITGHCIGSISTKIEAKSEIIFTVANQVEAQAGINLIINKEARDCRLRSGGTVLGKKSALIGGAIYCACGVEAREIGARGGSKTLISLSSDVAMSKEFAENQQLIVDHEKILVLLKAHLGPLAKTEAGLAGLSEKHKERLMPIIVKKRAVETSLLELKLTRDELLISAHTNHLFRVNFLEKLHSGVIIKAGDEEFNAKDSIAGPKSMTYSPEKKAFELGDLGELECSIIESIEVSKEKSNERKQNK